MEEELDSPLELCGTIRGWSQKFGISQDVLWERFKELPTQDCVGHDPENPGCQIVTAAYPATEVLAAVKDLLVAVEPHSERMKWLLENLQEGMPWVRDLDDKPKDEN